MLIIYIGITIYSGLRLFAFIKLKHPFFKARFFWPFYTVFPYGFIFLAVFRLDRIESLRLAGLYLPPLFIYLFCFIFLFDMISLVLFLRKRKSSGLMPAGVGFALILTGLVLIYGSFHARDIKNTYYNLDFFGNTETRLRIALVSDLHIGPTVEKKWISRIVDKINAASPDMVCMAGDIFDSGVDGMADPEGIAFELRRINAPLGVYACPGNHDTNRRTRSIEEISGFLDKAGIPLLTDKAVSINLTDNLPDIVVAGRRDARPIGVQGRRLSAQELKNNIAGTSKSFIILLDHQPIELREAAEAGFNLVLCGHTHKGQFFPGNIFTCFIFKKAGVTHYGHWQKGNTHAIISSGAGVWGPPLRLATNSEIVIIDVK